MHTLARLLAPELTGQRPRAVRARRKLGSRVAALAGRRIISVASQGKHLYMDFEDGSRLASHLGLYGSWHRYAPGEPWHKPERQASLVVTLADRIFVCFNAREVALLPTVGFAALDRGLRLGPDLTRVTPDPALLAARARELLPLDTPAVDLLLDQRVAAGIGNVYKCEVLFLSRCPPLRPLGDLLGAPAGRAAVPVGSAEPRGTSTFDALYLTAAQLLRRNLGGGPRVTREGAGDGRGNLWVYGRAGQPCFACGTPVARDRLGRNPRSTYWCPACQVQHGAGGCVGSRVCQVRISNPGASAT